MDIDIERLTELMRLMDENDLAELEVESGEFKVRLKKRAAHGGLEMGGALGMVPPGLAPTGVGPVPAGHPPVGVPAAAAEDLIEITSPMVGTFYRSPAPEADPYVRVGDTVHEDSVICIIEAMKVMNEIKAEAEGTIAEVKVENGETVEFGQVLFTLRPAR